MATGPRDAAIGVVRELQDAGHVALFAGGCVRDELLGEEPKDYDVATDAPPDRIADLFHRTRSVGRSFGVMQVRLKRQTIEVATFRQEHGYTDGRRPDHVTFCDAETDAHRRDFTINAMFIDPLDEAERIGGRVIDYVNGQSDLSAKLIRAVGDPDHRLNEDHLRALRAVRFASRLAFHIEDGTAAAVHRHARDLAGVSRERVGDELRMMLAHPRRGAAVSLLQQLGLDGPVLGESSRGHHAVGIVDRLPREGGFAESLAAWAIDRLREAGQEKVEPMRILSAAPEIRKRWRRSLCLSNQESADLFELLQGVAEAEMAWAEWRVARRKRFGGSVLAGSILRLIEAREESLGRVISEQIQELAGTEGGLTPEPLVSGDGLIQMGLEPGPRFKDWLERVYDEQLEGRVKTEEEGLAVVLKWANSE